MSIPFQAAAKVEGHDADVVPREGHRTTEPAAVLSQSQSSLPCLVLPCLVCPTCVAPALPAAYFHKLYFIHSFSRSLSPPSFFHSPFPPPLISSTSILTLPPLRTSSQLTSISIDLPSILSIDPPPSSWQSSTCPSMRQARPSW